MCSSRVPQLQKMHNGIGRHGTPVNTYQYLIVAFKSTVSIGFTRFQEQGTGTQEENKKEQSTDHTWTPSMQCLSVVLTCSLLESLKNNLRTHKNTQKSKTKQDHRFVLVISRQTQERGNAGTRTGNAGTLSVVWHQHGVISLFLVANSLVVLGAAP